jgi:uncharacterized membrane protein
METQSRWKSKVLWVALIAQVIALGQFTGLFASIGLDAGIVGNVFASILEIAVIIGIVNNPSSANTW